MPELPEVETVRRRLLTCLPGLLLREVVVNDWTVSVQTEQELNACLAGRRVTGLRRRGKYLLVDLGPVEEQAGRASGGPAGRTAPRPAWLRRPVRGRRPPAHDRPAGVPSRSPASGRRAFAGSSSRPRRCTSRTCAGSAASGRCEPAAEDEFFAARGMGPEPFGPEFTVEYLRGALRDRRAPLKAFLLDQRRIAGVGNIYADEALFRARLHPLRAAGSVGPREARRLHAAVLETLQAGIDHEGSSIESFIDPAGQRGSFQEILNVYQRTGEPCRVCGTHRRARRGRRPRHALLPALPAAPRRHGAGVAAASRRDRAAALGQARRLGGAGPVNDRAPAAVVRRGRRSPVRADRASTSSSPACRVAPRCAVGSLGTVTFERGWYAYVGSAARAREARVARHLARGEAAALARRLPLHRLPGGARLAGRRRGRGVRARRRAGGAARRGAPPAPLRRRRLPLRRTPRALHAPALAPRPRGRGARRRRAAAAGRYGPSPPAPPPPDIFVLQSAERFSRPYLGI